jgi:hypothetical protein
LNQEYFIAISMLKDSEELDSTALLSKFAKEYSLGIPTDKEVSHYACV